MDDYLLSIRIEWIFFSDQLFFFSFNSYGDQLPYTHTHTCDHLKNSFHLKHSVGRRVFFFKFIYMNFFCFLNTLNETPTMFIFIVALSFSVYGFVSSVLFVTVHSFKEFSSRFLFLFVSFACTRPDQHTSTYILISVWILLSLIDVGNRKKSATNLNKFRTNTHLRYTHRKDEI